MDKNSSIEIREEALTAVVGGMDEGFDKQSMQKEIINILMMRSGKQTVFPDSRLVEELGMDSLDVVDVVNAIEHKFGVKIKYPPMTQFNNVEDIVNFIYAGLPTES